MRHLFVMDPLDRIHVAGDSTYVTMREACDRGRDVYACTPDQLFVEEGRARGRVTPVQVIASAPYFRPRDLEICDLGAFDVVWMRKDPPFDMNYVFTTWLLDLVPEHTLVVNDPLGLKRFNEKLWAMQWTEFHPRSLLARDAAQIRAFVEALPGKAVLKPWSGNGGRGVLVTEKGDRNLGSMIELLTNEGREYLIAQEYVAGIVRGDKRVLLFEGEPVAAILRVPSERDHRGNIHVGARVEACEITPREREICEALGPELRRHGLVFVGIDVIDGRLTEINVTSPTGLQEANRLYGLKLEADLLDRVERLAANRRITRRAESSTSA